MVSYLNSSYFGSFFEISNNWSTSLRNALFGDTYLITKPIERDFIYTTTAHYWPQAFLDYKCSCVAQAVLCDALKEYNNDDIVREICNAKDMLFNYCTPQSTAATIYDVGVVLTGVASVILGCAGIFAFYAVFTHVPPPLPDPDVDPDSNPPVPA